MDTVRRKEDRKYMDEVYLTRPSIEHKSQYESMMDEWELYSSRLNPGALSRYSNRRKR